MDLRLKGGGLASLPSLPPCFGKVRSIVLPYPLDLPLPHDLLGINYLRICESRIAPYRRPCLSNCDLYIFQAFWCEKVQQHYVPWYLKLKYLYLECISLANIIFEAKWINQPTCQTLQEISIGLTLPEQSKTVILTQRRLNVICSLLNDLQSSRKMPKSILTGSVSWRQHPARVHSGSSNIGRFTKPRTWSRIISYSPKFSVGKLSWSTLVSHYTTLL